MASHGATDDVIYFAKIMEGKGTLVYFTWVSHFILSPYLLSHPSKKFLIRSWLRLLKILSRSYFNSRSWWKGFKRFQNLDQDLILIILHKILFGEVSKSWWIIKIFTRSLKDLNKNSNFLDKILLKTHFKNFLLGYAPPSQTMTKSSAITSNNTSMKRLSRCWGSRRQR